MWVQAALRVARNVRAELTDAFLEIVVQGGAADLIVTDDDLTAEVPAGVLVVPAAVAHLARRQWKGWAYVRL